MGDGDKRQTNDRYCQPVQIFPLTDRDYSSSSSSSSGT